MRRTLRRTAGLLGLLALTFAFAESVSAAACVPVPESDAAAVELSAPPLGGCDLLFGHPDEREQDEDGERRCPFGPAAAQVCAGPAILPSHVADLFAPSPDGAIRLASDEARHDLLIGPALFRPPRA